MNKLDIVPAELIPACVPTPTDDLMLVFSACSEMETLCTKLQGLGLSACQVGLPWNLFVYLADEKKKRYEYYLNCSYVGEGEKIDSIEGCLSLLNPDNSLRRFELKRYAQVYVKGYELKVYPELKVVPCDLFLEKLPAIVFQHEIDHANSILIKDIGKEIYLT